MRKFESAAMLAALAWAFIFGQAAAQTISYPQRPVRILVGLAPGGNPDVLARLLAAKLTEAFGQQFLVENRPGAGNAIAVDAVARSQPDGHTIFVGTSGVVTTNPHVYKELPYDPFRDILPVSLAAVVPMWLVVHPSVPARSVQELVALARAQKQPMPYASSGNGSIHHLTMEAFKSETRVDFSHVPYKGASQSVPAMIAGEVALGFVGYPALASAVQAGRLRVLAFSLSRRSTLTPEVPTVAETVAPGFDMSAPLGVFVGAGTRRELVARLSQAISEAVRSPDLVGRMSAIGMEPVGSTPEEYAKTLREEHQRFGVLIKRIGMRLD
jgi:tripartite-type tricarboxylate transporter receptor subunit TctC